MAFASLRSVRTVVTRWATLAVGALWVVPAGAAQDLFSVWQQAEQHNAQYAADLAATQADQEAVAQARANLLPTLNAEASLSSSDRRAVRNLQHGQQHNINQWAFTLRQPVINLQALSLYEGAQHQAAAAVLRSEAARQQLMLRVSQQYFDILAAQDRLRSLHAEYQAIDQQLHAAERSFELGGATITDTYEARSRLDLLRNQQLAAERDLRDRLQQLTTLLGQPVNDLAVLNTRIRLSPLEHTERHDWLSQAEQANLEVLQRQLLWQASQSQLTAAKREHTPTLSLQARSGSSNQQGIYGMNQGPRALDSSVGLELAIPLYQGGAISSRVRERSARVHEQRFLLEQQRRDAREAAQRHLDGVQSGLQQVAALEAAEQSSRASVEANELAYEVGVRVSVDVLNAQRQLYETQRALAQARYDALMQSLRLKAATGSLDEQDLLRLNQLLEHDTLE